MIAGLAAVTATAALGLMGVGMRLRRRYVAIDIVGASMEPGYRSGDRVLVQRTACAKVRRGEAVVFEHSYDDGEAAGADGVEADPHPGERPRPAWVGDPGEVRSWLLKRAVAVPGDPIPRDRVPALRDVPESMVPAGHLIVIGDNPPASLDSRHFGYVTEESVLGVVVRHLTPLQSPAGSRAR